MYRITSYNTTDQTNIQVYSRETALKIADEWSNDCKRVVDVYEDDKIIWQSIPTRE